MDKKESNPKDTAATTRLDLSVFPATARAYGALAMVEGDLKYGAYNYRNVGVGASTYYAAAGRHLDKWYNGEEYDPKTRVPHLASALACIAVLIDGIEKRNWTDDRPPKVDLGDVLDRFQKVVEHLQNIFPRKTPRFTEKDPNDLYKPVSNTGTNVVGISTNPADYRPKGSVHGNSSGEQQLSLDGI